MANLEDKDDGKMNGLESRLDNIGSQLEGIKREISWLGWTLYGIGITFVLSYCANNAKAQDSIDLNRPVAFSQAEHYSHN